MSTQADAKIHSSELPTGQAPLQTHSMSERAADFLIPGEEILPVEHSILSFDFNRSSQLRILRNYERSNVDAHVATPDLQVSFRTRHVCMASIDSDNVILQQATEKFGLAELQKSGVEHPADVLADAFDAFEVLPLLH